jgi:hypothetical protein
MSSNSRFMFVVVVLFTASFMATAQDTTEQRLKALEQKLQQLATATEEPSKFTTGGYGEIHINQEQSGNKQADIHRFVLYLGYDFADWIKLNSEVEIEHAFVADGNGELSIEQLYTDFLINDNMNLRAGRVIVPVGLINQRHEPTTFNGVERPSVDRVIIPSTWFAESVGVHGSLNPVLRYEMYLMNSLDGSKFSALNGIRDGRQKQQPGLSELAVSGRVDIYPLMNSDLSIPQQLRLGASFFTGGVDNGNKGQNPKPSIDSSVDLYALDMEYSIGKIDIRGEGVLTKINGAGNINFAYNNNIASTIMGYYIEAGYHFWLDRWKTGKLKKSDAVIFTRFEKFNTQHKMPVGAVANKAGDREELTVGISFFPTQNIVVKSDYQIRNNATGNKVNKIINLGLGWLF